jgi:hypothetical protein
VGLWTPIAAPPPGLLGASAPRDFQAHADGLSAGHEFAEHGVRICEQLFWAWEIYQHTGERRDLRRRVRALRRELKPILQPILGRGAALQALPRAGAQPTEGLARAVDLHHDKGVEPINNHAERALRGAVIYRKISLDSQSDRGERRIARTTRVVGAGVELVPVPRKSECARPKGPCQAQPRPLILPAQRGSKFGPEAPVIPTNGDKYPQTANIW